MANEQNLMSIQEVNSRRSREEHRKIVQRWKKISRNKKTKKSNERHHENAFKLRFTRIRR